MAKKTLNVDGDELKAFKLFCVRNNLKIGDAGSDALKQFRLSKGNTDGQSKAKTDGPGTPKPARR